MTILKLVKEIQRTNSCYVRLRKTRSNFVREWEKLSLADRQRALRIMQIEYDLKSCDVPGEDVFKDLGC